MSWLERRACVGVPPAVFFPGGSVATARAICASCPVRDECLADALERREPAGVWGGLTARERRSLQKPPRRPSVAACGSDAGYYRHIRQTHTEPCRPCRDAHATAARERKRDRPLSLSHLCARVSA